MKRSWISFGVVVLVSLVGYGWWWLSTRNVSARDRSPIVHHVEDTVARPCPGSAVRIYVSRAGAVTLNGQALLASDLRQALISLKPAPSEVCLYWERKRIWGEPPRGNEMVALTAIAASQLRISSYTDGTFRTAWKLQ